MKFLATFLLLALVAYSVAVDDDGLNENGQGGSSKPTTPTKKADSGFLNFLKKMFQKFQKLFHKSPIEKYLKFSRSQLVRSLPVL